MPLVLDPPVLARHLVEGHQLDDLLVGERERYFGAFR